MLELASEKKMLFNLCSRPREVAYLPKVKQLLQSKHNSPDAGRHSVALLLASGSEALTLQKEAQITRSLHRLWTQRRHGA